jgi:hypothetical protein
LPSFQKLVTALDALGQCGSSCRFEQVIPVISIVLTQQSEIGLALSEAMSACGFNDAGCWLPGASASSAVLAAPGAEWQQTGYRANPR